MRLQYPVVRITKCAECEHHREAIYIQPDGSKSEPRSYCPCVSKDIPDANIIPDWCRLPSVADLKKELGL